MSDHPVAPPPAKKSNDAATGLLVVGGLGAAGIATWLFLRHKGVLPGSPPAPGSKSQTGSFQWRGWTYDFIVTADADEAAAFFWGPFCTPGSPECGKTKARESDANARLAYFNPNPKSCPAGKLFWTAPRDVPTWSWSTNAWWLTHVYGGPIPTGCSG